MYGLQQNHHEEAYLSAVSSFNTRVLKDGFQCNLFPDALDPEM
jgi:hypothetical protein